MRKTGSIEALERYRRRGQRREDAARLRMMQQFPALATSASAASLVMVTTPQAAFEKGLPTTTTKARPAGERKAFGAPKSLFESSVHELGGLNDLLAERAAKRMEASSAFAYSRRRRGGGTGGSGNQDDGDDSEDESRQLKPIESALHKVRDVAEKLLESSQMDLRGFEGEAMDEETFRRRVKSQLGISLTRAETKALVRHMDENQDGQIDFKEVLHHFLNPERLRGSARRAFRRRTVVDRFRITMDRIREAAADIKLEDLFRKFDEDGDHRVSRQEFTEVLQDALHLQLADADVAEVFRCFDPDGDGSLSFSEFAFAYYNRRGFEKKLETLQGGSKLRARRRTRPPFVPY